MCIVLGLTCAACSSGASGPTTEDLAKIEAERDALKGELEKAKSENDLLSAQVASLQTKIEAAEQEKEVQEGDITVILTNKTTSEGDYGQIYANFEFAVTNNLDKPIKGVQGIANFNDIFGASIVRLGGDFTGATIEPGETRIFNDLSLDCNRFIPEQLKLYNTKYDDIKLNYEVKSIVFTDGTSKTN